ncbi:MAG: hypothetical protein JNL60_16670 [Bacteroidia bacterium]|nr:hypothetical protein [Bacteroidia bacterium]
MRAIFFYIFFLVAFCSANAVNADLIRVRQLYYKASSNKADAEQLDKFLSSSPNLGGTLLSGYKGMCYMIKANHAWNPYNKLSYFVKGRDLLDEAIHKNPSNIELRFLRFCVQTNAPVFLAYSGQIDEDKAIMVKGYTQLKDEDLRQRIKNYLVTSKYCSATDKLMLK